MSRTVRFVVLPLIAGLLFAASIAAQPAPAGSDPRIRETGRTQLPVYLVENGGVYPAPVAYFLRDATKTIYFTPDGVTIRMAGAERDWAIKQQFVGASGSARPVGEGEREARFHYYQGRAEDWRTDLRTFERVVYRDLWPGIDHVYRTDADCLKYDFVVRPGAEPSRIRVAIHGADRVRITEEGALVVETPNGVLTDSAPIAWQTIAGRRSPVGVRFVVEPNATGDGHEVSFRVDRYDPGHTLVIDPAVLVYCGYVGGFESDQIEAVTADAQGQAIVVGFTLSDEKSFPLRGGPGSKHANTTTPDAFVAKVRADGKGLVYCGYIGGYFDDRLQAVAVDPSGNAYVAGYTKSDEKTFPVLVGPRLWKAGHTEAFVAKVDTLGKLIYCGYIGGTYSDIARGIAVDTKGAAYVTGETSSTESSFPVKVGPDLTYNGGGPSGGDAFIAKVNSSGRSLDYCGYIGGSNVERAYAAAVDAQGRAIVGGRTESSQTTFPATVGPDVTYNAGKGYSDSFICRVAADGKKLEYCGYIGGDKGEGIYGVAVDPKGAAYATGSTNSTPTSFPRRIGPFLSYQGNGAVFVAKVNTAGTALAYCGYISGAGIDGAKSVAVDHAGVAYVAGMTTSDGKSFPVLEGPDLTRNPSYYLDFDGFVARVKASGAGLDYCGYIGGAWNTTLSGLGIDPAGNAYVAGGTFNTETSFPVKVGPRLQWIGKDEGWVAKVSHTVIDGPFSKRIGSYFNLQLKSSNDAGLPYQVGSSTGKLPIPIDTRKLYLTPNELLRISTYSLWPSIFQNYSGKLDARGEAVARVNIPSMPALIGVMIYSAFVTIDPAAPSGLRSISNTVGVILSA